MASILRRFQEVGLGGLLLALVLALAGCGQESTDGGGGGDAPTAKTPPPAKAPAEAPPAPAEPEAKPPASSAVTDDGTTVTVALTGNDALQYNLREIRVPAGRRVRLTLTHIGKGSKETMGHNFVLLQPGTDVNAFGLAAATAQATDYIPEAQRDRILAHTDLVGGGESSTIEFDAPPPGTYDYMCSFTGHFAAMNGKLIVE